MSDPDQFLATLPVALIGIASIFGLVAADAWRRLYQGQSKAAQQVAYLATSLAMGLASAGTLIGLLSGRF